MCWFMSQTRSGYKACQCIAELMCSKKPCQNGGTCIEEIEKGSYKCDCPREFTGDQCGAGEF